jgi:hypothetical protein
MTWAACEFCFSEPDIPGGATLTLTVELLDVQPAVDYTKLTIEERLQFG